MNPEQFKAIIEAALFAAGEPLNIESLQKIFAPEMPSADEIKNVLILIAQDYEQRSLELKQTASGYRFQVKQDYSTWVSKLWEEKPPRLSRALLETLALIAYRQPITRAEIEDVRGVSVSSGIIKTLLDRDWIKIVGHREVPGKPALYATTKQFLDDLNLMSLQQLPELSEIKELDSIEDEIAKQLQLEVSTSTTATVDLTTPEFEPAAAAAVESTQNEMADPNEMTDSY